MLPIPYLRCMTLPAFRAQLELDIERAQRYGRPLTVAILDLDRFRYLNMNRGYATGEIMRQHPVIGERIMRAMPGMGSIARVVPTSTSAGTAAVIRTGLPVKRSR